MKRTIIICYLVSIILSFASPVPFVAVSGNRGVPVFMDIKIGNGSGAWINVENTVVDEYLIRSIKDAYSLTMPGQVKIRFYDNYLSGPSGGLMLYLFLKYNDTSILASGQIAGSEILPVGAEYEKAILAKTLGYKYFMTAPGSILDFYLLRKLEDKDFHVLFVETIGEADKAYKLKKSFFPKRLFTLPEVPEKSCPYNTSWLLPIYQKFRKEILEEQIGDPIIDEYWMNFTKQMDKIIEKNCIYTAANFLFIELAKKRALLDVVKNKSIKTRKDEVKGCIKEFLNPANDIAVGASLRMRWASRTLEELPIDLEENTTEEKFSAFFKLEEAALWCELAHALYKEGNFSINKEKVEKLLVGNQKRTAEYLDAIWFYLKNCPICAAYSIAYLDGSEDEFLSEYHSPWAQVYASQAFYLREIGSNYGEVLSIANNIEQIYRLAIIGKSLNFLDDKLLLFIGGVICGAGCYYLVCKIAKTLCQSHFKAKNRRYTYSRNRRAKRKT